MYCAMPSIPSSRHAAIGVAPASVSISSIPSSQIFWVAGSISIAIPARERGSSLFYRATHLQGLPVPLLSTKEPLPSILTEKSALRCQQRSFHNRSLCESSVLRRTHLNLYQ